MLYFGHRDLGNFINPDRVYYGEGRGEFGTCLHLPLKNHMAGAAPMEDYMVMLGVANNLIEFLLYTRVVKGPELWDYDAEKAAEHFEVCGDNPNSSGVIIIDKNYNAGPKIQIFLDKTFGSNEVSIRWKNQMVGDDKLLDEYEQYLKAALVDGSLTSRDAPQ
ncbi:MAG: hypothetical protein R6X14_07545 [bacterium]